MKNLTKKLLTVLMAVLMVIGAAAQTAYAANEKIEVTGAEDGATVTFYQIAKVTYSGSNTKPMEDWEYYWVGANPAVPAANQLINADKLKDLIDADADVVEQQISDWLLAIDTIKLDEKAVIVANKSASWQAEPGVYLAVVTNNAAGDIRVYNPVLLSLTYKDGNLSDQSVSFLTDKYQNTGHLKSTKPGVDKAVVDGTVQDPEKPVATYNGKTGKDQYDEDADWEKTYNAGEGSPLARTEGAKTLTKEEPVKYVVKIDVPQYPKGATNRTMWAQDTLPDGVIFQETPVMTVGGYPVTAATAADVAAETFFELKEGDKIVKNADGKIFAKVMYKANGKGWQMVFNYDVLDAAKVKEVFVEYTAKLTDAAAIGRVGNINEVEYRYSNEPYVGGTHKDEKTGPTKGCEEVKDEEIIYTYTVAIVKTDVNDNRLAGAKFTVYYSATKLADFAAEFDANGDLLATSELEEILTDEVTPADGIIRLTHQKYGFYYFVETEAPYGYNIVKDNVQNVTLVEATWKDAVQKASTSKRIEWTSEANKALDPQNPEEDGYLDDKGNHITDEQYEALSDTDKQKYVRAYVKGRYEQFEVVNQELGSTAEPVGINSKDVVNTKEPALPSTGGVGTYVFTIAGVAILATAAFMLIFRKREDA